MQANSNTLYRCNIKSFPLSSSGKVRDIYNIDDEHLLIVTSDRLSAFDVILPDPIPGKGSILTEVSNFWFERSKNIIPNHLSDLAIKDIIDKKVELEILKGIGNYFPLAIKIEVQVFPMYERVPNWGELIDFLYKLNYMTCEWTEIGNHATRSPAEMDMLLIPNFLTEQGKKLII